MNDKILRLADYSIKIGESASGTLSGGFVIIQPTANVRIIGGGEEPNTNCAGGNCFSGCGETNHYAGCGGAPINNVPGCGTN